MRLNINGTDYKVTSIIIGQMLSIDFEGITAEQAKEALSTPAALNELKFYETQTDGTEKLVYDLIGYNQFAGVELTDKVRGHLLKESTLDEQRITALEAKTAANQTETTTNGAQATYTALMTDTILKSEETA